MKTFFAFLFLFTPFLAFSHPGHDHSHWSAAIIHLGLFVSFIALVFVGYKVIQIKKRGTKLNKD